MWTVIGFGVSQLLRLGGNLALTRLLSPGVFGVMALVNAVLQGLQMFSDFGTRQSVIQHRRGDDPDFVNTAWTFQAVRGGALWLTACALAAPLSLVYPGTGIGWLLPAAGLTAAIAGLASTKEVTLNRHLNIGRVSMVEIVAQCLGLAVMIVWAWRAPSVWALIGGAIVGVGVRTALTHVVLPGPWNRFCWEWSAVRDLVDFGKWLLLASVIGFLSEQGDRLLLGKIMSSTELGVYSVAFFLAEFVSQAVSRLTHVVLFPAFSRLAREAPERLRAGYYRSRFAIDMVCAPAGGFLVGAGPLVVRLLYDWRYAEAGAMVQALALRTLFTCATTPGAGALLALGQPRYATIAKVMTAVWIMTGIPLGFWLGGLSGAVWAVGLAYALPAGYFVRALKKHGLIEWRGELRTVVMFCGGVAVGLFAAAICFGD